MRRRRRKRRRRKVEWASRKGCVVGVREVRKAQDEGNNEEQSRRQISFVIRVLSRVGLCYKKATNSARQQRRRSEEQTGSEDVTNRRREANIGTAWPDGRQEEDEEGGEEFEREQEVATTNDRTDGRFRLHKIVWPGNLSSAAGGPHLQQPLVFLLTAILLALICAGGHKEPAVAAAAEPTERWLHESNGDENKWPAGETDAGGELNDKQEEHYYYLGESPFALIICSR